MFNTLRRYINRLVKSPVCRKLRSFSFTGVPFLYGKSAKMYFEILNGKTMEKIYSTKDLPMEKFEFINDMIDRNDTNELLPLSATDITFTGDLLFRVKNGSSYSHSKLFRFSVNTAFLGDYFELDAEKLDPDSFIKDTRFKPYFKVCLVSERTCRKCLNSKPVEDLCSLCQVNLESEIDAWREINIILTSLESNPETRPTYEKALKMHFNNSDPDYEQILDRNHLDSSKMRLISGSIYKNRQDKEVISINIFGRRITVPASNSSGSNKNNESNENEEGKQNMIFFEGMLSPTASHDIRMKNIFNNLMLGDDSEKENISKVISTHRLKTFANSFPKILPNDEDEAKVQETEDFNINIVEEPNEKSEQPDNQISLVIQDIESKHIQAPNNVNIASQKRKSKMMMCNRREKNAGSLYDQLMESTLKKYENQQSNEKLEENKDENSNDIQSAESDENDEEGDIQNFFDLNEKKGSSWDIINYDEIPFDDRGNKAQRLANNS